MINIEKVEEQLSKEFKKINDICLFNSNKVLTAFRNNHVSEIHFSQTTGYGYNDIGRETIENIYNEIFKSESSLVRTQFISGSHALSTTLFALLRPGDTLLSITGKPYDTLDEVIGIRENKSSLKSYNIKYKQIDLIENQFDIEKIKQVLTNEPIKVILIQRSKGYSTRKSISIDKLENIITQIKQIDNKVIIMIDNCYCEFVNKKEPIEVGADIAVGSLIKNLGGGITPNGAYVVGRKDLIDLTAERLTLPGEGKEVGPTLGINKQILQGLFMAPSTVKQALKTAILTSKLFEDLNYDVEPKYNEERVDIVQNIIFNDKNKLIKYCKSIQKYSPIDSNVTPIPSDMPGYKDQVIMSAGTFNQGSSIELSCDAPIRKPYIAYQQGSLTYEYGKIAVINAINELENQ